MDTGQIRLLIVAESYHPVYSGAAVRFRRYLPGLRSRGIDVRVLTGTPKAEKAGMTEVPGHWAAAPVGDRLPIDRVDGFDVQRVRLPDSNDAARARWLARRAVEECDGASAPHIVQTSSLVPAWGPALRELRGRGIATINIRTMVPGRAGDPIRWWRQRHRNRPLLRAVDRVIVSSGAMRAALQKWGVQDPVVIPHGVDIRRFRPCEDPDERRRTRSEWGGKDADLVCMYAGPISPRKGVEELLELWPQVRLAVPAACLVLVGPRRDASDPRLEDFGTRIEALAKAEGASGTVHFTGMVQDVERYLRSADLFAFPSRREGMPNVFAEAMASGLPVISRPFTGLPTEYGRPGSEFILAAESELLARAIIELLRDKEARKRVGLAARRWVESNLDVEHSLDAYVDVYQELVRRNACESGLLEV